MVQSWHSGLWLLLHIVIMMMKIAFLPSIYIDGLVQDCSNSSVLSVELLQFCTEPLLSFILDAYLILPHI